MGVRDDDGVRGSVRGKRIDVEMRAEMRVRAVNRQLSVEFANEIQ
jgi:hypothetical protein